MRFGILRGEQREGKGNPGLDEAVELKVGLEEAGEGDVDVVGVPEAVPAPQLRPVDEAGDGAGPGQGGRAAVGVPGEGDGGEEGEEAG